MISLDKKMKLRDVTPSIIFEQSNIIDECINNILQKAFSKILEKFQNNTFTTTTIPPVKFLWFTLQEGYTLAKCDHIEYKIYMHNIYPHIETKYTGNRKSDIRDYYNANKIKYFTDMCRTLETYLAMYIDNKFIQIDFCENTFRRIDTICFTALIGFEKND